MSTSLRVLLATIVNGITVYGVFVGGWTVATALALYWSENVLGIVLLALLFTIHRIVTHKRGHQRGLLQAFLFQSSLFTFFHGVFLGLFIFLIFPNITTTELFNPAQFKLGMMMIGGVLLVRFLIDVAMVKNMPFVTLREKSEAFMSRVVIVHLTIIFGMIAMGASGRPRGMFAVFAALKFLIDLIPVSDPRLSPKKQRAAQAQIADDELVQA